MVLSLKEESQVGALYVHVPFCSHKCEYCAFYSELLKPDVVEGYVSALCKELAMVSSMVRPRTLFFGGGTPSILSLAQWERILSTIHGFDWGEIAEWTVECNPSTVSREKANLLKQGGVNRISMGIQSMDEELLQKLGRIHSREQVFRSYDILREAGFENINLDLMFGIPGQTLEQWRCSLREIIGLGPEHLSAYEVIYEDDTPLFHQLKAGEFDVNEDAIEEMYEALLEESALHGFVQYEVANFAKGICKDSTTRVPSHACQHNINYWRCGDYYGVGPAASEWVAGMRNQHIANTEIYAQQVGQGQRGLSSSEAVHPSTRLGEAAAFSMRMNAGIDFAAFQGRFGVHPKSLWESQMNQMVDQGWALWEPTCFRPTTQGLRFADAIGAEFVHLEG